MQFEILHQTIEISFRDFLCDVKLLKLRYCIQCHFEDLLNYLREKYTKSDHNLKYNDELKKWVITTLNTQECSEEDLLAESFNDIRILEFADITTWKKETIKDIGGEEAFNQEYDLRFINSSRSLLSETLIDELSKNKKIGIFPVHEDLIDVGDYQSYENANVNFFR